MRRILILSFCACAMALSPACKKRGDDGMLLLALLAGDDSPLKPLKLSYPSGSQNDAEVAFALSTLSGTHADMAAFDYYNWAYFGTSAHEKPGKRVQALLHRQIQKIKTDAIRAANVSIPIAIDYNFIVNDSCGAGATYATGHLTGTTKYDVPADGSYARVWIDITDIDMEISLGPGIEDGCTPNVLSFSNPGSITQKQTSWPFKQDVQRDAVEGKIRITNGTYNLDDTMTGETTSGISRAVLPMETEAGFVANGAAFSLSGTEEYVTYYKTHLEDWAQNHLKGYDTFTGTANGAQMELTIPYSYNPLDGTGGSGGSGSKLTWTEVSTLPTGSTLATLYGVRYLGEFWAVGSKGIVMKSGDGISWASVPVSCGSSTDSLYDIASDGTRLVIVGSSGVRYTSVDGSSWTCGTLGSSSYFWTGIKYLNGLWVTYGHHYTNKTMAITVSSDGSSWSAVGSTASYVASSILDSLEDATYYAGRYTVVGANGWLASCTTSCGTIGNWSYTQESTNRKYYSGIIQRSGTYYLMTNLNSLYNMTYADYTADFSTFTQNTGFQEAVLNVADDGTTARAVSYDTVWASADGITWTTVGYFHYLNARAIACSSTRCVAVGEAGSSPRVAYK